MRKKIIYELFCVFVALLAAQTLRAQGTAFTYQGRLDDSGSPANGIYDLRFTIYDSMIDGSAVSDSLTNFNTAVS
ncbi:MAG: hypothetical protein ACREFE_17720, partial [Limisphaerales bacterium]